MPRRWPRGDDFTFELLKEKTIRPTSFAPDLVTFGRYIKNCRSRLRLTQEQLAERCGWTQERISILERGLYGTPSLVALACLCAGLEIQRRDVLVPLGYLE